MTSAETPDTVPPLDCAVDVHAHFLTPRLRAAYRAAGIDGPDGMPGVPSWTPEAALATMDQIGTATALLSVSSPGVHLGGQAGLAATRALARAVNDEGAALVRDHPARFGLLASLPLPDVQAAIEEAAYALDTLGADGIALATHYDGVYLGDPRFEPVLAELDRRPAVVVLHPTTPVCGQQTALGRSRPMVEFLFDTTRTIAQLALNGVLDRHPGLRLIVPHAGAALPVLADRIACFAVMDNPEAPVDVLAALRRLHYDVAGFTLPRALPALLSLVPPEQLLYGSDYPFTPDWVAEGLARDLATTDALTQEQLRAVVSGNAALLFPRLTAVHGT
ncbi:amidohydrolase family protein [Streptomyces sp. NPDC091272]|uniref:amidohydrolase family protein n=1 Tax=Streptomyces sp. NPDC091272 TaxID=3365981 RepID=UPI0038014A35